MKKGFLVLVVLMVLMALCASAAQATNEMGWEIVFDLNGKTASIGASDYGSGFALANQNYSGAHIGVGPIGSIEGVVYFGARQPLGETIAMWNNATTDFTGTLSWQWLNYDELWQSYRVGLKPTDIDVHLSLIPWGGTSTSLNPNGGSIPVSLVRNNGTANANVRITLQSNPVPEPSAFLALGSGLIGLLGVVKRRR